MGGALTKGRGLEEEEEEEEEDLLLEEGTTAEEVEEEGIKAEEEETLSFPGRFVAFPAMVSVCFLWY